MLFTQKDKVPNLFIFLDKKESRNTIHNTQIAVNKTEHFGFKKGNLNLESEDNLNQTTLPDLKAGEKIIKQSFGLKRPTAVQANSKFQTQAIKIPEILKRENAKKSE